MNPNLTRRSLLKASLAVWPGSLSLSPRGSNNAGLPSRSSPHESPQPHSTQVTLSDGPKRATFTNGIVTVMVEKRSGLASYEWSGHRKVTNAYSTVDAGGILKSTDYTQRTLAANPTELHDGLGHGIRFTVVNRADNRPDLLQHYSLYEGRPFFLVQTEIRGSQPMATNYMGPVVVDGPGGVDVGTVNQNRVLHVPFDNDMWFRYDSMEINGAGLSSEATAVFDNASRNGLVFGSVTHDTWKTGIRFSGSNGRLDKLEIFGGLATSGVRSATHDSLPHGKVNGAAVSSPVIFVGYFEDWRDGLEEYGRANAIFKPPLVWKQAIPFGWNSWAAYAGHIDYSKYLGVADFISHKLAPQGFQHDHVLYFNLDAFWSRLDESQLRDALDTLKNLSRDTGLDLRPGIYMAPFATWDKSFDGYVEGTNLKYRYHDILLKKPDGSALPPLDGGTPLDPTHPGTEARIRTNIKTFKALGFRYLKLDFLGHATLEGAHWQTSVQTGIQAYSHGMKFILDEIGDEMFVSLSIAPIFPGGCGHARRISCDTMGHISGRNQSVEYMLNSLTYGWWTSPALYIADPDHIPLGPLANQGARNENEARSRFLSAVISGGMILDSSAYPDDSTARELALKAYSSPGVNALAAYGKPFRPVEGNTGDQAADVFVREQNGVYYLAVFNLNGEAAAAKQVSLDRVSKTLADANNVSVTDLWTGKPLGAAGGSLSFSLAPAESRLLKLVPL